MTKRKGSTIPDHFRSRRNRPFLQAVSTQARRVQAATLSRNFNSRMVAPRRRIALGKRKRQSRRRLVRRRPAKKSRKQRRRKTPKNGIKWEQQAIQSLIYDYADDFQPYVPLGGLPSDGKRCVYGWPRCDTINATNLGSGLRGLMGISHITDMATQIQQQQVDRSYAGPNVSSIEQKFVVKDCYQTSTLINTSNASCIITAYKCMWMRDVNTFAAPSQALGDGFVQRGLTAGGPGTQNYGITDASLSPFDSHKFCSYVKILSTNKSEIECGGTKMYTVKRSKPKTVNTAHYYTQVNLNSGIIDFSSPLFVRLKGEQFYLFKVEGMPSNDSSTKTNNYWTSPKIDMITKTHYNFACLSPQQPYMVKQPALGYVAPIGNNETLNEASGTIQVEING